MTILRRGAHAALLAGSIFVAFFATSDVSAQPSCNGFGPDRLGHIREGICMARSADVRSPEQSWASCESLLAGCVDGDCHLARDICKGVAGARSWPNCDDQNRGKPMFAVEFYPAGGHRKGACIAAKGLACPAGGDAEVRDTCAIVKSELATPAPAPPPTPSAAPPAPTKPPIKERLFGIADTHMHLFGEYGHGGWFQQGKVWDETNARACTPAEQRQSQRQLRRGQRVPQGRAMAEVHGKPEVVRQSAPTRLRVVAQARARSRGTSAHRHAGGQLRGALREHREGAGHRAEAVVPRHGGDREHDRQDEGVRAPRRDDRRRSTCSSRSPTRSG